MPAPDLNGGLDPDKDADVLAAWVERTGRQDSGPCRACLRFAFYGRVSTEDWQDPVTSRARQRDQAAALVTGHGKIVTDFFDSGHSRTLPWARRPQAAALVAALADPDRGWDAIVIGEYERAFYASQYASITPLFEHYGVSLWMPEVGGQVDWHAEDQGARGVGPPGVPAMPFTALASLFGRLEYVVITVLPSLRAACTTARSVKIVVPNGPWCYGPRPI